MSDPLHQFLIQVLIPFHIWGIDLSFTNASMFMLLAVAGITAFLLFGLRNPSAQKPSRYQLVVENMLGFVKDLTEDILGPHLGKSSARLTPVVFAVFFFILTVNLLGIIPHTYTVTSQFIVTLAIATFMFMIGTVLGLTRHGLRFFKRFMPSGVPLAIAPIIIPIEIVSYLFRPISLGVRLFANMFAGHIVLKIFAGLSVIMGAALGFVPMLFNVLFMLFELFVACLQAYIFTILSCVYIRDAWELH